MKERSRDARSSHASLAGESPCHSIVKFKRASSDLITRTPDNTLTIGPSSEPGRPAFAMCRGKAPPIAAFGRRVGCDEHAIFEDADLVGEDVHIEDTATCGVGDAVEIAADAHHALMGEPSFELQHRAIGDKR